MDNKTTIKCSNWRRRRKNKSARKKSLGQQISTMIRRYDIWASVVMKGKGEKEGMSQNCILEKTMFCWSILCSFPVRQFLLPLLLSQHVWNTPFRIISTTIHQQKEHSTRKSAKMVIPSFFPFPLKYIHNFLVNWDSGFNFFLKWLENWDLLKYENVS